MYESNTTFDFLDYIFSDNRKFKSFRYLSKTIVVKILNKLSLKIFNYDFVRVYFLKYLKNIDKDELVKLSNDFYINFLENKKRDVIINHLLKLKIDNNILLVSATIDIVAERIAKEFSVNYLSSKLKYNNNICTGSLSLDLLGCKEKFIKEKIELLVTDNISDLKLAKIANNCIIVSKKKNIKFWERQDIANIEIVEVN
jgi:phosphoserine phosphatase